MATETLTQRVTVLVSTVGRGVAGTGVAGAGVVGSGVVGSGLRGSAGVGAAWALGARTTTGAAAAVAATSVRDRLRVRGVIHVAFVIRRPRGHVATARDLGPALQGSHRQ